MNPLGVVELGDSENSYDAAIVLSHRLVVPGTGWSRVLGGPGYGVVRCVRCGGPLCAVLGGGNMEHFFCIFNFP